MSGGSRPGEPGAELRQMPEGYHTVTPWIVSRGDGDAVYCRALEAGAASVTEMAELYFGDRGHGKTGSRPTASRTAEVSGSEASARRFDRYVLPAPSRDA